LPKSAAHSPGNCDSGSPPNPGASRSARNRWYARLGLVVPPNLTLAWVSPAWAEEGVVVMFQHMARDPDFDIRQQMLHLTSTHTDPTQAAEDMANQLLEVFPEDWARMLGQIS